MNIKKNVVKEEPYFTKEQIERALKKLNKDEKGVNNNGKAGKRS